MFRFIRGNNITHSPLCNKNGPYLVSDLQKMCSEFTDDLHKAETANLLLRMLLSQDYDIASNIIVRLLKLSKILSATTVDDLNCDKLLKEVQQYCFKCYKDQFDGSQLFKKLVALLPNIFNSYITSADAQHFKRLIEVAYNQYGISLEADLIKYASIELGISLKPRNVFENLKIGFFRTFVPQSKVRKLNQGDQCPRIQIEKVAINPPSTVSRITKSPKKQNPPIIIDKDDIFNTDNNKPSSIVILNEALYENIENSQSNIKTVNIADDHQVVEPTIYSMKETKNYDISTISELNIGVTSSQSNSNDQIHTSVLPTISKLTIEKSRLEEQFLSPREEFHYHLCRLQQDLPVNTNEFYKLQNEIEEKLSLHGSTIHNHVACLDGLKTCLLSTEDKFYSEIGVLMVNCWLVNYKNLDTTSDQKITAIKKIVDLYSNKKQYGTASIDLIDINLGDVLYLTTSNPFMEQLLSKLLRDCNNNFDRLNKNIDPHVHDDFSLAVSIIRYPLIKEEQEILPFVTGKVAAFETLLDQVKMGYARPSEITNWFNAVIDDPHYFISKFEHRKFCIDNTSFDIEEYHQFFIRYMFLVKLRNILDSFIRNKIDSKLLKVLIILFNNLESYSRQMRDAKLAFPITLPGVKVKIENLDEIYRWFSSSAKSLRERYQESVYRNHHA